MTFEDRKLLIIGFQLSLIVHLVLFILLRLLPVKVLDFNYNQPIEITIEETKKEIQEKKVKIEQKVIHEEKKPKIEKQTVKTEEEKKEVRQNTQKAETVVKKSTSATTEKSQGAKPSNPDMLKIDDENLKLLNQLSSSSAAAKEGGKVKSEEISFGESLSKIDSSVNGTASSRSVIYKPPPPKIVTSETLPAVKVKIWINPDGSVSKVELLTTTGDPQANATIISYMKRWKFNKISSNEIQWAVVTIKFGS
ncbi:MAG: TonB family protein [Sulfurihydrogenibium sp.]